MSGITLFDFFRRDFSSAPAQDMQALCDSIDFLDPAVCAALIEEAGQETVLHELNDMFSRRRQCFCHGAEIVIDITAKVRRIVRIHGNHQAVIQK